MADNTTAGDAGTLAAPRPLAGLPPRRAFAASTGSPFAASGGVALRLVEVNVHPAPAGFESFAIRFTGPADRALCQGTHRLDHDELGSFDLFMVPIRADGDEVRYEACFNRPVGD